MSETNDMILNDKEERTMDLEMEKAVMAEDAAACQAILDAFPATLQSLGYDSICQERTELAQNIVLE